jgi:uncharacterized protein
MPAKAVIKPLEGALDRDFIRVGQSRIAGKGVFAKRRIPQGSRIVEYKGKRVTIGALLTALAAGKPSNVYAFRIAADTVIDGSRNGNDARFINHSCDPNCEVFIFGGRVYIYSMRDILRHEELTFDYQLGPAASVPGTKPDLSGLVCLCGAKNCRGTMVSKESMRRIARDAKIKAPKAAKSKVRKKV